MLILIGLLLAGSLFLSYISFYAHPKAIIRFKVFTYVLRIRIKEYKRALQAIRSEMSKLAQFADTQQKTINVLKLKQVNILLDKLHGLINVQSDMFEKLLFPPSAIKNITNNDFIAIRDNFLDIESHKNKTMDEIIGLGDNSEINFYSEESGGGMYAPISVYKEKYKDDFIKHIFSELNHKFKTSIFTMVVNEPAVEERDPDMSNGDFFMDLIDSLGAGDRKKLTKGSGLNKKRQ